MEERKRILLLITVLIVSTSGIAYELIAGTMATYLIGQSVTQFSFATGWFMAAMGLGSYLSRFTKDKLFAVLINVQILLSIVGGFSAVILFFAFAYTDTLYPFFLVLALIIGTGVGFEIPIILRIIGEHKILSIAVSDVFTFDYIGALFASIAFPLFLLPYIGLIRSSILFGMMNLLAALIVFAIIKEVISNKQKVLLAISIVLLFAGFFGSEVLTKWIEEALYQDPIVLTKETKYQRIVITKWKDDLRLYLNGNLQFSTRDEFRYHESLVHVPISLMKKDPASVLILGGGDGMALREVWKYPSVQSATLIDLDDGMIALFKNNKNLNRFNKKSLSSTKLEIVNDDAFQWLKDSSNTKKYDLIIADLPDPNSYSLGKLYTVSFYIEALKHLSPDGIFITQATSSTFAPEVFWCIKATIDFSLKKLNRANWNTLPYHAYIPSFGDWGFIIAGESISTEGMRDLTIPVRYLNKQTIPSLFVFSQDILPEKEIPINQLNDQILVNIYANTYHKWYQ